MVAQIEVPIFVETNLGTRIAIAVSPDITAGDLKRELERAHVDSFPGLGEVTSITVMVKQKSYFYCLPDMLPIKHACQGCKKVWFVHVNACLSNKLEKISTQKCLVPETRASHSRVNDHLKVNKNNASIKCKKAKQRRIWCLKAVILGLVAATYAIRKKKKRKRRHILKKVPIEDNIELEPGYVVDHPSCMETGTENGNSSQFKGGFGGWDVPKYPNGDVSGTGNNNFLKLPCIIVDHGQVSDAPKGEGDYQKEVLESDQVWGSSDTAETPGESLSGTASVSGIINRYFSNLVELEQIDSSWSSVVSTRAEQGQVNEQQADAENTFSSMPRTTKRSSVRKTTQRLFPSPLLEDSNSVGLGNKYQRSEVGERLVTASNSLRQCQSKERSSITNLCKGKKFLESDAGTLVRSLVFELGDDD